VSLCLYKCVFGPPGRSHEGLQGEAPRDEAARARRRPRRLRHAECKRYMLIFTSSGRGSARRGALPAKSASAGQAGGEEGGGRWWRRIG